MTARQPRTAQEAAMLDPMGLMSYPAPNIPRGLFGSAVRRPLASSRAGASLPPQYTGMMTPSPAVSDQNAPPSIDQAPPPPADWKSALGPDMVAQLSAAGGETSNLPTLPPAPPMRGGPLMAPSGGMIGNAARFPQMTEQTANLPQRAGAAGLQGDVLHDQKKKGGFDWRMAAGILGDMLGGLNGQPPMYAQNMFKLRQQREEYNQRLAQLNQEWQYRNNQPDYATVGNRRFSYNPATGEANTLYTAPTEAEDYATALGAQPGTEEWNTYVQDYNLKYSGPTATDLNMREEDNKQEGRVALEGVRQNNRVGLESVRQGNRVSLRSTPTYRDSHPRPSTPRSGGSGGGKGDRTSRAAIDNAPEGATGTANGVKYVKRGGKWVPMK